jgi:hypothetical protein
MNEAELYVGCSFTNRRYGRGEGDSGRTGETFAVYILVLYDKF